MLLESKDNDIEKSMREWEEWDKRFLEAIDIAIEALREPARKTGKWIPHEDEDGEHYGDKCSECGEWYVMPYGKTNFCPNCGSFNGDDNEVDKK